MLGLFSPIQAGLSKYLKYQEIRNANVVFRLHCVLTAVILVSASILLTATQLVGSPILCFSDSKGRAAEWSKAIETFCWVSSTFTVPDAINTEGNYLEANANDDNINDLKKQMSRLTDQISKLEAGSHRRYKRGARDSDRGYDRDNGLYELQNQMKVPYQGIQNEHGSNGEKKYYPYYQWVCFVLFFQAIMCYLPQVIWDFKEAGLLEKLGTGLGKTGSCGTDERGKKTDAIICYLMQYKNEHKTYALLYWGCEALCLLNLVLQMMMMNSFLQGDFFSYGMKALRWAETVQFKRFDPLIYIFPRVTKCTFYYYGPSGGIVNLDNMCILPQNVINEKIYIFLWFWYIALAVVLALVIVYRLLILCMPSIRPRLLAVRCQSLALSTAVEASDKVDFGDWWMLYLLAKNVHPIAYRDLINDFVKRSNKMSLFSYDKPLLEGKPVSNPVYA